MKDDRGRVRRSVKGKSEIFFFGVIPTVRVALFQDRPEALCLERGSRDNVGGDYREGIRTI